MKTKPDNKNLEIMMHCGKYLNVVVEQHQEDWVTIYWLFQLIKNFMVSIEKYYFQHSQQFLSPFISYLFSI